MELVWGHGWFKESGFKPNKSAQYENKREEIFNESKKLFCTVCKNYITDLDAAISINGAQSHTFSNPAGYSYTIDCFHSAPGCQVIGDATEDFTWFNGYAWQIVTCDACREQLGWFYTNGNNFYGLISDRLTHMSSHS